MIPIRNTFTSNGIDAVADSRTRLDEEAIMSDGSSIDRMNLIGINKTIVKTIRRYSMQSIVDKQAIL